MRGHAKHIIQRIGETDQLYLQGNTPELALERADLRLQLVMLSQMRQEQIHFLQEAVVLLEQSRIEVEEIIPSSMYMNLSLHLAKAYMLYYEITRELRFALIVQQILKPMKHDDYGDIYFFLAYACVVKKEFSLARHWLAKYSKTQAFDLDLMRQHAAFSPLHQELWFSQLIESKLN